MALTIPYPTMSAAFAPTGAATVDQFSPTTVHNDAAHNNPHAKLLANDVAIASSVNTLETAVASIGGIVGFTSSVLAGPVLLTTSYATLLSVPYAKVRSDSVLFILCPFSAKGVVGSDRETIGSYVVNVGGSDYLDSLKYVATGGYSFSGAYVSMLYNSNVVAVFSDILPAGALTLALRGRKETTPDNGAGQNVINMQIFVFEIKGA